MDDGIVLWKQLRNEDSQQALAELAVCPVVHLAASVDHINAPIMWDVAVASKFNWVSQSRCGVQVPPCDEVNEHLDSCGYISAWIVERLDIVTCASVIFHFWRNEMSCSIYYISTWVGLTYVLSHAANRALYLTQIWVSYQKDCEILPSELVSRLWPYCMSSWREEAGGTSSPRRLYLFSAMLLNLFVFSSLLSCRENGLCTSWYFRSVPLPPIPLSLLVRARSLSDSYLGYAMVNVCWVGVGLDAMPLWMRGTCRRNPPVPPPLSVASKTGLARDQHLPPVHGRGE